MANWKTQQIRGELKSPDFSPFVIVLKNGKIFSNISGEKCQK